MGILNTRISTLIALLIAVLMLMAHPIQMQEMNSFTFMNDNSSVTIDLQDRISLALRFKSVSRSGTLLQVQFDGATIADLQISGEGLILRHFELRKPKRAVLFKIQISDMTWHSLVLNIENEGLKFSIDDILAFLPHKIDASNARRGWTVTVGKPKEKTSKAGRNAFIGCIHIGGDDYAAIRVESVRRGCFNACSLQTCHHGGMCINRITTAVCKCQGTGYEGPNCEQASLAIALDQRSYISMDVSRNPSIATGDILQTRLKTHQKEGLLLHSRFKRGHLILAVVDGAVRIDIALNHRKLSGFLNEIKVDDGQWHFFELHVIGKYIVAKVDHKTVWKRKWCNQYQSRDINNKIDLSGDEEVVYLGGVSQPSKMPQVKGMKNFIGDIQQTKFNGLDVIKKLLFENDWRFTHVGLLPSHVDNN